MAWSETEQKRIQGIEENIIEMRKEDETHDGKLNDIHSDLRILTKGIMGDPENPKDLGMRGMVLDNTKARLESENQLKWYKRTAVTSFIALCLFAVKALFTSLIAKGPTP